MSVKYVDILSGKSNTRHPTFLKKIMWVPSSLPCSLVTPDQRILFHGVSHEITTAEYILKRLANTFQKQNRSDMFLPTWPLKVL